jgi:murein DD-endopeptidase MepM/ murein hydrolase activator NlpD
VSSSAKKSPRRGRRNIFTRFSGKLGGILRGLTGHNSAPKKAAQRPQPAPPPEAFEELKIARPKSRPVPPRPNPLAGVKPVAPHANGKANNAAEPAASQSGGGKLLGKLRARFSRSAPQEAPPAPAAAAAPALEREELSQERLRSAEPPKSQSISVEAARTPENIRVVAPPEPAAAPPQTQPESEGAEALRQKLRERFSRQPVAPKAPSGSGNAGESLRDTLREQFRPASSASQANQSVQASPVKPPKIAVVEQKAKAVLSGAEKPDKSRAEKAAPAEVPVKKQDESARPAIAPETRAPEKPGNGTKTSKNNDAPKAADWGRLSRGSQPGRSRRVWGVSFILFLAAAVSALAWWYSPEKFSDEARNPVPKVTRKTTAALPEIAPLAPGFYELWAREREAMVRNEVTITPGSSLGKALEDVGVGSRQGSPAIIETLTGEGGLSVVRPGAVVKSYWNDLSRTELSRLEYYPDSGEAPLVLLPKGDGGFLRYSLATMPLTVSRASEGTVSSSLWEAGAKAGLDANVILSVTEVLASDVDFFTDIQKDDAFQVLYNRDYSDGRPQGAPTIEMIKLVNKGRVYEYYRFENKDGFVGYYDPEYRSSIKSFFATPLQYKRISSQFSMARKHPIFKKVRPHQGVDYAAPSGTPVSAVANGTVIFCGWSGGYGKLVTIKHDETYTTMYAHLSDWAPGLKKGSVVSQGDLIGKVGATGTATGPHLDFRLKKNNVFIDPLPELAKQQGKKIEDKEDQQAFASVVGRIRERMRQQLAAAVPHEQ